MYVRLHVVQMFIFIGRQARDPSWRRSRGDLSEIAFRVSWWGYKVILVEVGRCESKDLRSPT